MSQVSEKIYVIRLQINPNWLNFIKDTLKYAIKDTRIRIANTESTLAWFIVKQSKNQISYQPQYSQLERFAFPHAIFDFKAKRHLSQQQLLIIYPIPLLIQQNQTVKYFQCENSLPSTSLLTSNLNLNYQSPIQSEGQNESKLKQGENPTLSFDKKLFEKRDNLIFNQIQLLFERLNQSIQNQQQPREQVSIDINFDKGIYSQILYSSLSRVSEKLTENQTISKIFKKYNEDNDRQNISLKISAIIKNIRILSKNRTIKQEDIIIFFRNNFNHFQHNIKSKDLLLKITKTVKIFKIILLDQLKRNCLCDILTRKRTHKRNIQSEVRKIRKMLNKISKISTCLD